MYCHVKAKHKKHSKVKLTFSANKDLLFCDFCKKMFFKQHNFDKHNCKMDKSAMSPTAEPNPQYSLREDNSVTSPTPVHISAHQILNN